MMSSYRLYVDRKFCLQKKNMNIHIIDFLYIAMVAISQLIKFFHHVSLQDVHDERGNID